jgi:hypothetical protein
MTDGGFFANRIDYAYKNTLFHCNKKNCRNTIFHFAEEFSKINAWLSSHTVCILGLRQKRIAEDAEVPASMTRNTQSQRNHNLL